MGFSSKCAKRAKKEPTGKGWLVDWWAGVNRITSQTVAIPPHVTRKVTRNALGLCVADLEAAGILEADLSAGPAGGIGSLPLYYARRTAPPERRSDACVPKAAVDPSALEDS